MDIENYVEELYRMHIDHPQIINQAGAMITAGGEDGVLLWLDQRRQDTYAVDITEHFGLTPGRVANIVKKLERRKYILRVSDHEDQRRVRIQVTEEGHRKARELYEDMCRRHTVVLESLGEEAPHFMESLHRLMKLAEAYSAR